MNAQAQSAEKTAYQNVQISTQSDRLIAARVFDAEAPKAVVIVAGAMGVEQHCYEKFARFLCDQGMTVLTFDYFGTGRSLQMPLSECDTDIAQWGEEDCNALVQYARRQYPALNVRWVGHSVGGQLLGMTPQVNELERAVTVACGSGYWWRNSPPTRRIAWFLWYALAPLSVGMLGYFPGKKLGIVGDLPGPAMRQWRRWCLHPEYAVGAEGEPTRAQFARVTIPITCVAFTDDEMMSRHNVESLHSFYSNAPVTMLRIRPADIGEKTVGHLGWFRERYRESIWRGTLLPLLE